MSALRSSLCCSLRPLKPYSRLKSLFFPRSFTVLALESSADDTCAAVVNSERQILSNVVIGQSHIHEITGGIEPWLAIHAHQENMPKAIRKALSDAQLTMNEIDGIAFTRGPGIGGALSVCGNAARNMAAALSKPLVGVHHMQAHALTPFLTGPSSSDGGEVTASDPQYPFLSVLVSGGHTLALLATSPLQFRILATTTDESIGRCFDKVARHLRLQWGDRGLGSALERCAAGDDSVDAVRAASQEELQEAVEREAKLRARLPRIFLNELAFSFSGLHSSMQTAIQERGGPENLSPIERAGMARAFQGAAVAQLEEKVELAIKWCHDQGIIVRDIVVSGGVASNAFLRQRLRACAETVRQNTGTTMHLHFPPLEYCTDNAAMIAWASMYRFLSGDFDDYSIQSKPKWSIDSLASAGH